MKLSIHILIALLLVSFSSTEVIKGEPEIGGTIRLEGNFLSDETSKISELSVEVVNLQTNKMETIELVKSKMKLDLKLGFKYMVYVKKIGFATKKILVDARDAKRGNYKFEFEMALQELDANYSTNTFKPICILKYNRLKQKFDYDSDYTSVAKSELRQEIYSKR